MIHKGLIDENTYKYEILPNGLRVLFVSNPQLDKSACSISIQTGSNDDTFPGIAHFLEHMLFMGTEKYSRENEWDDFLNLHHGSTNATTDLGVTTYFFDISPDHFVDALDRFCEFFVSPLFNANSVEREIEAVDSEFKNGLLNDCQRLYRMTNIMSTSKYNKFSCGNRNTLSIPNIREKVIQFWKNNYTSDEMCLVIYHNQDIEKDVKERFARIPKINKNKRIERADVLFEKHVFDDKNMNRLIYVNTISDIKQLNIFVEVPKHMNIFRDNSYGYIDFLLNKKGVDSLNYKLCQQKYAFDMNANVENYMDFSFVVLEIGLTDLGFAGCEAVINTIKLHFEDMFGSESNYKEYRKYMKRTFDYMEQDLPIDFVYNLSNDMQYFPIENVLDHDAICEKYNEDEIKMIVNIMKDSSNWLVFVQGKDVAPKECLKEEFYGIEYSVNDQTLKGMPKFMEVNSDDGRLIYLYEDKYKIPESYATILLNTEITQENYLARLLYIKMCENEYIRLHDEFLVLNRISINTKLTPDGFMVHFDGFNDNLIKAIKLFFEVFLVLPINNFELTKESIKQNLSCEMNQSPYRLLTKKFSSLIYKNIPETKSLVGQLEKITYSDVNTNTHKYFIEMVVSGTGNFYGFKDLFLDTTKKMQKWIKINNGISVAENTTASFTTQDTVNNACGLYLYGGKNNDKKAVAILSLIVQIGNEMFYDEFRTKEAFGYVVSNRMLSIHEDNYGAYIVQSERGNDVIEKRVHQFIADLQVLIDNMDDDELETHKESVISDYSEQFKNLKEFHAFYLELHFSNSFDLTYREDVIKAVGAVTKDELKVSAMSAAVILANKNEDQ